MDLERFFSVAPNSAMTANDVFINREAEKRAFFDAVGEMHWSGARPRELVESLAIPRENVVVFYGMGGIGKSTLSRRLQRAFDANPLRDVRKSVSVRIDFSEPASFDIEAILLHLRASLGKLSPTFPAFDLALAAYWERKHPGEPLVEFLESRSGFAGVANALDLREQIEGSLDGLLGGLGLVTTGIRLGTLIKDGLVQRLTERQLLKTCPYFSPLINEPAPEKMRPFLPSLLAWDLAGQQLREPIGAVVF